MSRENNRRLPGSRILTGVALVTLAWLVAEQATARPQIRQAFFAVYPNAAGTVLDSVPSRAGHCGVCHFDFSGGGARNPYGNAVASALPSFPNTDQGKQDAIWSIRLADSDLDGYTSQLEITDTVNFANTPTFPGLTPGNVASVTSVSLADLQSHLVPTASGDTTPPTVTVLFPNGGETLTANNSAFVQWTATDASGVSAISLWLSLDNGATYSLLAEGLGNTGSYVWYPPNRPTTSARVLVRAIDNAFNAGEDASNAVFTVASPPGGAVPTTLRDFDQPGTQPFEAGILNPPEACAVCHGNYSPAVEPYFNWQGSMMAQASRDPLFKACMTIANQDAPDSGDLCLRCHKARGWLDGRSVPTDGSQMLISDDIGVACDFCHRLVDPIPSPLNPVEDTGILAALVQAPTTFGNGMFVVDPTGARRGPFTNADSGHPVLVSPFHREAALCGTCHDVSNPAFSHSGLGTYPPNALDTPAPDFSAAALMPIERTYSEWLASAYNSAAGIYSAAFGGNKSYVATCQDCHMRDVTGQGCNTNPPVRHDLPLHDMTGGSTWLPTLLPALFPSEVDAGALMAGVARAEYLLQNAASLTAVQDGRTLRVRVANEAGHKLPTGYPEGRRVWINVKYFDAAKNLLSESGVYDSATGELAHDAEMQVFEAKPGLDHDVAGILGEPYGPSFHFVLNNKIHKDNRIPPRGFSHAAFAVFGGAPVGATYADGQYWADADYAIPREAVRAEVTLYYQSTSKEYIEFLRDRNVTDTTGQELYDLWANNGKCPPTTIGALDLEFVPTGPADADGDGDVDEADLAAWEACALGPGGGVPLGCEAFDADGDEDIDLGDFATMQQVWTGPLDHFAPAAVQSLVAIPGAGAITLNWFAGTESDLHEYEVRRSLTPGGPYTPLASTPAGVTAYADEDVAFGTTYYYVVAAVDESDNAGPASTEVGAAPLPTASPTMHVASVVASLDDQGGGNKYGVATVTIVDAAGQLVAGAAVTGSFTGDFSGGGTATTNASGVAVLTIGPKGGRTNFQFCVTSVTHVTLAYDPASNVQTCGIYP